MKKSEFITSTRQLIKAGTFRGRSSKLEDSLSMLCDALEKNTAVDGSKLSAQVTAGWYAHAQQGTGSDMAMTSDAAWSWLFEHIGKLDNSIYKSTHREHLEKEFRSGNYSQEVQDLWRDVYADQNGPKNASRFRSMNLASEDIFSLSNEQKLIALIESLSTNLTRGQWATVATGVNVGIRGSSNQKEISTSSYSIVLNPGTHRLDVFQKTGPINKLVTQGVDNVFKFLVDKLNLNQSEPVPSQSLN